jgi:dTDP-4-dehydrorhamnose 3,5-epimerase
VIPRVFPPTTRGFFTETFRESALAEAAIHDPWIQDNHSRSGFGVVRGLHFTLAEVAGELPFTY